MLDIELQSWIYFFAGHPVVNKLFNKRNESLKFNKAN